LHYTYLTMSVIVSLCVALLVRRYLTQRTTLTLAFTAFMVSYAINAFLFAVRGFFLDGSPEEVLLWRLTNVMYVAMVIPLAVFLAYPYLQEKAGTTKATMVKLVIGFSFVVAIFNLMMVAVSEVDPTYVDDYGLPHYQLVSFIPNTYVLTLFLVILVGLFSPVFLIIGARRETDSFYRNRALMLAVGWVVVIIGQVLMLNRTLVIANPFVTLAGLLLIVTAVLRKKGV